MGRMGAAPPPVLVVKKEKPKREKVKIDPKLKEAARELRDRYLEKVNEDGFGLAAGGKYDLCRTVVKPVEARIAGEPTERRLAA